MIFDNRACDLGEGPLWHPVRNQLFWFDITGQRMLSVEKGEQRQWRFAEMVSAAAWVDREMLLIAGERDLFLFDVETEEIHSLVEMDPGNRATRSNDGRADPQGGFWIGTMGKKAEAGAGAIYRYYRGELRLLYPGITIPNAICFAPDGRTAHFTDTKTGLVMRTGLDTDGWPKGTPEVYLDLRAEGLNPDGAVIDALGVMWLAQWGASRVAGYDPAGQFLRAVRFDAPHTSCPSIGPDGALYCTSALQGMDAGARSAHPFAGMTFVEKGVAKGQAEHQVIL